MKQSWHSFLLIFILGLSACCDKDESNIYYFNETGCANPWDGYYELDSFTLPAYQEMIRSYLESEGIGVRFLDFQTDSSVMMFCLACHCTTGRVIETDVECGKHSKLIQLGFYQ